MQTIVTCRAAPTRLNTSISSVTVDAARKPSVKFQIKKDGTAVNFGTYNAATNANLIPNTIGGPSMRIAYNVTQDGITSPADFNAAMSVSLGCGEPDCQQYRRLYRPVHNEQPLGKWRNSDCQRHYLDAYRS